MDGEQERPAPPNDLPSDLTQTLIGFTHMPPVHQAASCII